MPLEQKVIVEFASRGNMAQVLAKAKQDALALNRALTDPAVQRSQTARIASMQQFSRTSAGAAGVIGTLFGAGAAMALARRNVGRMVSAGGAAFRGVTGAAPGNILGTMASLKLAGPSMPGLKALATPQGMTRPDAVSALVNQIRSMRDESMDRQGVVNMFRRLPQPKPETIQKKAAEVAELEKRLAGLKEANTAALEAESKALGEANKSLSGKRRGKDADKEALTKQIEANQKRQEEIKEAIKASNERNRLIQRVEAGKAQVETMKNVPKPIELGPVYEQYYADQKIAQEALRSMARQRIAFLRGRKASEGGQGTATTGKMIAAPERREAIRDLMRRQIRTDRLLEQEALEADLIQKSVLQRNMKSPATQQQLGKMSRTRLQSQALDNSVAWRNARIEERQVGGREFRSQAQTGFRREFAESRLALRQELATLKEREKFLTSPAGKNALAQQARLTKEIARETKAADFRKLSAEIGPVAAHLQTAAKRVKEFREGLNGVETGATRAFMAGSAAFLGFSKLASPFAFDRFTRAASDMGAVIGRTTLPYLEATTKAIRGMADGFLALDPATQSVIGKFIFYGTATAGVVLVGTKLIGMLGVMLGALGKIAAGARIAGLALQGMFAGTLIGRAGALIGLLGKFALGGAIFAAVDHFAGTGVLDKLFGRTKTVADVRSDVTVGPKERLSENVSPADFARRMNPMLDSLKKAADVTAAKGTPADRAMLSDPTFAFQTKAMVAGELARSRMFESLNSDAARGTELYATRRLLSSLTNATVATGGMSRQQAVSRYWQGQGVSEGAAGGGNPQYMGIANLRDYVQQQALAAPIVIPQQQLDEQKKMNRTLESIDRKLDGPAVLPGVPIPPNPSKLDPVPGDPRGADGPRPIRKGN